MKKIIILVIVFALAAGIIYVGKYWPLTDNKNTQGTLGGVQKAEKFRGKQMSEQDLTLDSPEVTKLTQSAEWQNAMKDEEFVKMLQSDHFQQGMRAIYKLQLLALYSAEWNKYFHNVDLQSIDAQEFVSKYHLSFDDINKSFLASGLKMFMNHDIDNMYQSAREFQKSMMFNSAEGDINFNVLKYVIHQSNIGKALAGDKDIQNMLVLNNDVNKGLGPDDFAEAVYKSLNFDKMYSGKMNSSVGTFSSDFNKYWSADFQKSIGAFGLDFNNTAFKVLAFNQSFQIIVFHLHEGDFQDFRHNQLKLNGW